MADTEIIILGAGGHAREVLGILEEMNRLGEGHWNIRGFVDDDPELNEAVIDGRRVLGGMGWLAGILGRSPKPQWPRAVCAVGSPASRRRIVLRMGELGLEFASAVSPYAAVSGCARLGAGCMVFPGAVIGPGVVVGCHAVINACATVSHECVLGDYATLAPGVHLAGNTTVGEGCDIGIGAVSVQGVRLGAWSILGAGAVAVGDLPGNGTAVGTPARVIKTREDKWHER